MIASCTDCDEEPAPGAPEDPFEGMPEDVAASVRAAFDREPEVETVDDCRRVWLDQMPFFVGAPDRVETLRAAFANVAYRVDIMREGTRDWGELHALGALRASDIPVLAITGERDRAQPPANARRIAEAAPRASWSCSTGPGTSRSPRTPRPTGARCETGWRDERPRHARPRPARARRRGAHDACAATASAPSAARAAPARRCSSA